MTGLPPIGRRAPGIVLFASAPGEPRARRPTDVVLAVVAAAGLVISAVGTQIAADLGTSLTTLLADLPPFLDPLWLGFSWAALAWALVLALAAAVRRRPALVRDMASGVVLAVLVAAVVARAAGEDAWAGLTRLGDVHGPPTFPPGAITISAAAVAVASPHLSRPFRHLGRWLVAGQVIAATMLGMAGAGGTATAIWIGLLAAAVVHLVVGSPGGLPTSSRIELALRELGLDAFDLTPATMQASGVVRFSGHDRDGPVDVKVYGRDAWDAQLLTSLWRLLWYRGRQRTARLSRVELVEHEGFITLLAERAGVRVPHVVTAGSAGRGDALVVVRPAGQLLVDDPIAPTDAALDALWDDLALLHDAGIAHQRIDLDRMLHDADGTLGFADLSSATVAESVAERREDRSQALALTIALAGEERAVARARARLGDDALLHALPYLQEAALPGGVRDLLSARRVDVDDVRNRTRVALGASEQQLIRLRRVTTGSLLNLLLLAVAAYALIGAFGGMDLDTFADALRDASWWWLAFALLLAQIPRFPAAISTTGSLAAPLPLGPLTALQFAICYVNLAIPSTAARVAINVRFFQRLGVAPATAMTAGVIDSVSGFVVQIVIFLTLFFTSDLDLHMSADASTTSGVATLVLIALAVVALAIIVVAMVTPLRRRVIAMVHQATAALRVLRSPSKLLRLFGGNLLSQVLFAVAFAACAESFGVHLPLSQLLLINTVVSLFAGLLPVPGGIGVSEAGLTFGLTTAGVPAETAFAIALAYRFTSFYLPPIWGWLCYRWLVRRHFL